MGKLIEFNSLDKTKPQVIQNKSNSDNNDKNMEFMKSFVTIPFTVEELVFLKSIIDNQYNEDEVAKTFKEKVFRRLTAGLSNVSEELIQDQVVTIHLIQLMCLHEVLLYELTINKDNAREKGLINKILYLINQKMNLYKNQIDEFSKLREDWQLDIMCDDLSALFDFKYGDSLFRKK